LFITTTFFERLEDPAFDVAASIMDILGGGAGAGLWGVFPFRAARGCLCGEGEARRDSSWCFGSGAILVFGLSPSIEEDDLTFLNVGSGSFSWSWADGKGGTDGI
jgi:hypothetical protein